MILHTESIMEESRFLPQVERLAREAFPPEEYLAPQTLLRMAREGQLVFLALTEEDRFVGYMAVRLYEDLVYLFFLAIDPSRRGQGYGSRALETLRARYSERQLVVDLEMQDDAAENSAQRQRRKAFYLKNGYRETGLFLSYLGVQYEVLRGQDAFDAEQFRRMMLSIVIADFRPRFWQTEDMVEGL